MSGVEEGYPTGSKADQDNCYITCEGTLLTVFLLAGRIVCMYIYKTKFLGGGDSYVKSTRMLVGNFVKIPLGDQYGHSSTIFNP